jgi:hypothetical protein
MRKVIRSPRQKISFFTQDQTDLKTYIEYLQNYLHNIFQKYYWGSNAVSMIFFLKNSENHLNF